MEKTKKETVALSTSLKDREANSMVMTVKECVEGDDKFFGRYSDDEGFTERDGDGEEDDEAVASFCT